MLNFKPTFPFGRFFCAFLKVLVGRAVKYILFALTLLVVLCIVPNSVEAGRVITVASAASLSAAIKEVAIKFEDDTGVAVRLSFASTGVLASQVESGAPFDLFIAADKKYADRLARKGLLVAGSVRSIAIGRLVIVVNKASGVKIGSIEELTRTSLRRIAIGNPAHVPYGIAAATALKNAGLLESMGDRLVYGENVRQVLQFVQSGNAAVGLVAESIARGKGIYTVSVPEEMYSPVENAGGVLTDSPNRKEATDFLELLLSNYGRTVLRSHGFSTIE